MDNPLIRLKNIYYKLNENLIIDNVSININHGQPTVIMGKNGAGKTTLLKLLAGIYRPTSGDIDYGKTKNPDIVSFLFQQHIFLDRSVSENLLHALTCTKKNDKDMSEQKIKDYLNEFNLTNYHDTHINKLSTGQKQLISLIRVFLIDSSIFFLDEPFNNLDQYYYSYVKDLLSDLSKTRKIILITHSKDEALYFTNDIISLETGRVV